MWRNITTSLITLLLLGGGLTASISDVTVLGTTSTQAVLRYKVTQQSACSVEVSESPVYAPLVADVNPALFPGADKDDRPGSIAAADQRTLVIGRRAAELAADGKRYSRALQTNNEYYYRLQCGPNTSDRFEGSFRTSNIPLGKTHSDPLPGDPANPGSYAWPTLSGTGRNESVIDPLTGLLLRRVSLPQDRSYNNHSLEFSRAFDPENAWNDPGEAVGGGMATYSGTSTPQAWLYLRPNSVSYGPDAGYENLRASTDYVQITMEAACSGSSCKSASAADRAIEVCLTISGVSCATAVKEQVLTDKKREYVIGTTTPIMDSWTVPGRPPLSTPDLATRRGRVNTDGTIVTRRSGNFFHTGWTRGSRIIISDVEYTIEAVQSAKSLLLASDAGTQDNVPYSAPNFGVLIRKQSASPDTIAVQNVRWNYGASAANFDWSAAGDADVCALTPVLLGDGKAGFHCNLSGSFFWIDSNSGESRYLGTTFMPARDGNDGWRSQWCSLSVATFDPDDPSVFYCSVDDNSQPQRKRILVRGRYKGDHEPREGEPNGADQGSSFEYTNLTRSSDGRDLGSLISAFDPSFDAERFHCGLQGVHPGKLIVQCRSGGQDSMGWFAVYDTREERIVAARNSWSKTPARWCVLHGGVPLADGWTTLDGNSYSGSSRAGNGPYESRLMSVLLSEPEACPSRPADSSLSEGEWPAGEQCSIVTVGGEPCDPTPVGFETSLVNSPRCGDPTHAYLQDALPGDVFLVDSEYVRLLAKDGNHWTLQRGHNRYRKPTAHAADSTLQTVCGDAPTQVQPRGYGKTFWNYLEDPRGDNASGTTSFSDLYDSGSHWSYGSDKMIEAAWADCPVVDGKRACYKIREDGLPGFVDASPRFANMSPPFAGKTGAGEPNAVQTHLSFMQVNASSEDQQWLLDMRPFVGGDRRFGTATQVNAAKQLYRVSGVDLARKTLPTFAVCGRHVLQDVSGPLSLLKDLPEDAYKYCVVGRAGECLPDTTSGDVGAVFVNCPYVTDLSCRNTTNQMYELTDICVGNQSAYLQGLAQVGFKSDDPEGRLGRLLTNGLSRYRLSSIYWNGKSLPDASWVLFRADWLEGARSDILLAKLPPYPAPDNVNRVDFVPVSLPIQAPDIDGIDNAVVEFGYAENGDPFDFHCTSRKESCVKGNQPGNEYAFLGDNPAGVPCATGCTIKVPAISQHVLYYRVLYRDKMNRVLRRTGPSALSLP